MSDAKPTPGAEVEMIKVTPMPRHHEPAAKSNPGGAYRAMVRERRFLRLAGYATLLGILWWRIPGKPEERQLLRDSITEYMMKKHDMRGVVDLEIYDELEAVGKLQRRKRWLGEAIPPANTAARELGFDVTRYPWNYDRRPPVTPWYHPTTVWYKWQRGFFYTSEEIAEIDLLYGS
eukprot:TRINITY_DN20008_c0_g1_i1.p2 TRINITY_DN20008_c0_g1~~TRINITY_DN20008_c0_g1_i1.p2  ORF type:complete len:176 (+),score=46.59 TRINITY_DN20008_c0_g1_i1:205-732(+)